MLSNKPILKFGQNDWKIWGGVGLEGKNYCIQSVNVYSNGKSVELIDKDKMYRAEVRNYIARFLYRL